MRLWHGAGKRNSRQNTTLSMRRALRTGSQGSGRILPYMISRGFDDRQVLQWLAVAVVVGALLYLLAPILAPFLFAAIVAYMCNPLVERLARRRVSRAFAATIVLVL